MLRLVLLASLSLVGCASSQRMDIADFDHYKLDCSKYEEQRAFLESQMSNTNDRVVAAFSTGSTLTQIFSAMNGTYDQHKAIHGRRYDAVARVQLRDLNERCVPGYQTPGVCDLARPESPACQSMRRR